VRVSAKHEIHSHFVSRAHTQTHTRKNAMFDFQKLVVYTKAKEFAKEMLSLIDLASFDKVVNDQLKRASLSIILNIAEGSSRFSNKDRRHFLIISRGSVFECVAILEFLLDNNVIKKEDYKKYFSNLEEISKMLFALIRKLDN
jgi:four helix bundle protein